MGKNMNEKKGKKMDKMEGKIMEWEEKGKQGKNYKNKILQVPSSHTKTKEKKLLSNGG